MSVDEWCSMWDEYSKNPERALEWQTQYMVFMFHLEDASGDGSIDVDEFISVCTCYGLKPDECRKAFQIMSKVNEPTGVSKLTIFHRTNTWDIHFTELTNIFLAKYLAMSYRWSVMRNWRRGIYKMAAPILHSKQSSNFCGWMVWNLIK